MSKHGFEDSDHVEIRVKIDDNTLSVVVPYQQGLWRHALDEANEAAIAKVAERASTRATTAGPFTFRDASVVAADNKLRVEALKLAVSLAEHIEDDQASVTQIAERYYRFLKTGVAPE